MRKLPTAVFAVALLAGVGALLLRPGSPPETVGRAGGTEPAPTANATATSNPTPRAEALVYSFTPGIPTAWRVGLESTVAFEAQAKETGKNLPNLAELALAGDLALEFAENGAGWDVKGRWRTGGLTINGRVPDWAEELETPFSLTLDRQGYVTSFTSRAGPDATQLLRRAVAALLPVLPRSASTEWTVRERDADGLLRSRYRLITSDSDGVTLMKEKIGYLAEGKTVPPEVRQSAWNWRLAREGAGVRVKSAEGGDALLSTQSGFLTTLSRTRVKIEETTSGDWLNAPYTERIGGGVGAAATGISTRGGAKITASGDFARFAAEWRSDPRRLEAEFKAWLAASPDNAREAVRRLNEINRTEGTGRPEELLHIWRVLAEVGTPEAQEALLDAAGNPAMTAQTRMEALGHISLVANPAPLLADGLLALYRSIPGSAEGDENTVRSMSILALGALGGDLAPEHAEKARITGLLESALSSAPTADAPDILEAVGNTGDRTLASAASGWAASEDPKTRYSVYRAYRKLDGPEAPAELTRLLDAETDPQARIGGIEVIAQMSPSEAAFSWARARLSDPTVRESEKIALVDYLGKNASAGGNADALRLAAENGGSRRVKAQVYRYVPPKR